MRIKNVKTKYRRTFLKSAAVGALTGGLLNAPANVSAHTFDANQSAELPSHRIKKLSLLSPAPLTDMATFYKDVLEMDVRLSDDKLVIQAGLTEISFTPAPKESKPFYHFAFNIPENKILSARTWLGERTKLAETPVQQRDKDFPNEVRFFRNWNAHAIYFWDPAGNILELICRHDMKNSSKGEFRSSEIFYASEIGFVANDVDQFAGEIKSTFQLPQYRQGSDRFRAIGDEQGLLIVFKRGGTPIGSLDNQSWEIHPTDVTVRPSIKLKSSKLPFSITTG